ncbi:hypothetical protein BGX28_000831 [Mortierella sp. GBA30]|nr:hypothetical protein BGX28_000831 [Mortierella sp. GBA30]
MALVKVASLVPTQHHCNLKLRVLSVEAIAETIHPETGRIVQTAEVIVGDDSACILLNLKNGKYLIYAFENLDQVNVLARNARLKVLNAHVNMYRGFMRLEVDEETQSSDRDRPSITPILDDEDEDEDEHYVKQEEDDETEDSTTTLLSSSRDNLEVEMRLGTGGSVSLMEYYRIVEHTYFSTVEPVGR